MQLIIKDKYIDILMEKDEADSLIEELNEVDIRFDKYTIWDLLELLESVRK